MTNDMDQGQLSDLLDSALKDFGKPRTSDDDLDELMKDFDRESIQKAAAKFNDMLEKMAEGKKQSFNESPSSSNDHGSSTSNSEDAEFIDSINKFLQHNSELASAPDDQSFMNALRDLDQKNPTVDGLMGAILQTALSRDVMYPAVKEMHERFVTFMQEKQTELSAEQRDQYTAQINIIEKLRKEYECEEPTSSPESNKSIAEQQSVRIGQLWVELQKAGLPPPEVAGADDILSEGNGAGSIPSDCSIM